MSWEWSHTAEGIQNARDNLFDLPLEDPAVIYSEIQVARYDEESNTYIEAWDGKDSKKYEKVLLKARTMDTETLAEAIWEFMESFRTCDRGGYNAYCCPYGCHTVPFDREVKEDD